MTRRGEQCAEGEAHYNRLLLCLLRSLAECSRKPIIRCSKWIKLGNSSERQWKLGRGSRNDWPIWSKRNSLQREFASACALAQCARERAEDTLRTRRERAEQFNWRSLLLNCFGGDLDENHFSRPPEKTLDRSIDSRRALLCALSNARPLAPRRHRFSPSVSRLFPFVASHRAASGGVFPMESRRARHSQVGRIAAMLKSGNLNTHARYGNCRQGREPPVDCRHLSWCARDRRRAWAANQEGLPP